MIQAIMLLGYYVGLCCVKLLLLWVVFGVLGYYYGLCYAKLSYYARLYCVRLLLWAILC